MRVQDIRIGETYQVKVPQRLPQALHTRYPRTRTEFAADMRLQQHRGDRFDLTVTDIAPETATVDGYEATTSRVTLRLTAEQAEFLELPAGPEYEIDGCTPTPTATRPSSPPPSPTPDSPPPGCAPSKSQSASPPAPPASTAPASRRRPPGWPPRTSPAAADAKEHQRDVAGQALDSYRAEQWLRIAEVQHQKWRRISALMTDTTRKTYTPKNDPEAIAE
ncbi:hypothetical protein G7Z12_00520 [Streptomyces sp. ID38640]|uniref:hypothetical protein n=1 Tax=Streptomyces sp. ID38640 TaxID=1265399 RepID=UPI00140ED8DD|nr:hypothetical protein [Streptomyces sp. ID38640]QIK04777.1 hypothetical protein G7Z12_00520 [Streptomyces sp. ID38640]